MRDGERQSSWIQPCLKLHKAILRHFSYMSQKHCNLQAKDYWRILGGSKSGEENT